MLTSTRKQVSVHASKAILDGLAPNGGLYVFESIDDSFFGEHLLNLSYQELSKKVFNELLDNFEEKDIDSIVKKAYKKDHFRPDMVKIKDYDKFAFLELFHGETFAFKDMALAILPYLFDQAKKIHKIDKKTIILTATSGDTGSATLSGFKKLDDTYVIVLYPKHGVSRFQELQMHYNANENCRLVPIDGNFDDCQKIVKSIFENTNPRHAILSSANSINIGRIVPQIVYYIYSYLQLCKEEKIVFGESMNVTVPTGNFGNIYAATIAKRLGVPIGKMVIASNSNKVLTDLFHHQTYDIARSFYKTISPSMDILVSSNFERYLYDLTLDIDLVNTYLKKLYKEKVVYIEELKDQTQFFATYASEMDTKETIKDVYEKLSYLIDPHTAVAYCSYQKYVKETKDDTYMLIVSTASPFKFPESVISALGKNNEKSLKEDIAYLKTLSKDVYDERIDDVLDADINTSSIDLDKAEEFVKKVIGEFDVEN